MNRHTILFVAISGAVSCVTLAPPTDGIRLLSMAQPEVRWESDKGLRGDFDCDDRRDEAFLGRAGGRVYVGVVRSGHPKPEVLEFAVDAGVQAAICAKLALLRVETQDYDPSEAVGEIEGFRRSTKCKAFDSKAASAIAFASSGTTRPTGSTGGGPDRRRASPRRSLLTSLSPLPRPAAP